MHPEFGRRYELRGLYCSHHDQRPSTCVGRSEGDADGPAHWLWLGDHDSTRGSASVTDLPYGHPFYSQRGTMVVENGEMVEDLDWPVAEIIHRRSPRSRLYADRTTLRDE